MLNTKRVYNGTVVVSHHLSVEVGLRVLRDSGNAEEAMIAAASVARHFEFFPL